MTKQAYISTSTAETEAVGEQLALRLRACGVRRAFIAIFGEMGVGKTALVRGFCRALGALSVHSPTYTVVNEYRGGVHPIFHFDMYRISDADDLASIGFDDYLMRDGYALCEWSENIVDELPTERIEVTLERLSDENSRSITVCGEA